MRRDVIGVASMLSAANVVAQNTSVVELPYELQFNLPAPFTGSNTNYSFLNSTRSADTQVNSLLEAANNAPITSFDPEFSRLVGRSPNVTLIQDRPGQRFAFEGGVWIPENDQAWFLSSVADAPTYISSLDLTTGAVRHLNVSGAFHNPNGLWYDAGTVYAATFSNPDTGYPGGIQAINVSTLVSRTLINSWFGRRFLFPDDLVVTAVGATKYLFFTDLGRGAIDMGYPGETERGEYETVQNGGGVWRYDLQAGRLRQVLGITDVAHPNGVRASPDGRKLYVASNGATSIYNTPALAAVAASDVYEYDLTSNGFPVGRKLFAPSPTHFADGMHVDKMGRVWAAEGDGIMVRNTEGDVMGMFNARYFEGIQSPEPLPIANFVLAGDTLVVLGASKLWSVKLNETVVDKGSPLEN